MDNANEPHNVIVLKHFTEKNRAVIVDVKTRKRKTGPKPHYCFEEQEETVRSLRGPACVVLKKQVVMA